MRASQRALWFVGGLTLLAFAFRLYGINTVSLRGDEAFTLIHWVREPLNQTLATIATVDPQPPLAYFLYWLWGQTVGDGELVVRLLPALVNTLGVPALFVLGKRLFGVRAGLLAALFWAISPVQIWHAQDARNYALWSASSTVSLWLALRVLDAARIRRDRLRDWLLYLIAASVTGYLYYLELFVVAALNVYVLVYFLRQGRVLLRWVVSQGFLAAILAVWYLQERLLVGSGYGGTAGRFDFQEIFTWFLPSLIFGDTLPPSFLQIALFVVILLLIWSIFVVFNKCYGHSRQYGLLLLLVVLPLVFLSLVSFYLNVFVPRYILSVSASLYLLMSSLISRRVVGIVGILVVVLGMFGFSVVLYYFDLDYAKAPDWRALAGFLDRTTNPDEMIVNTSADEAFTFYHSEYGVDAPFVRLPANPRQTDEEISTALAALDNGIWVVADAPADWNNRDAVDRWLQANRIQAIDTSINGLRAEYWIPPPPPTADPGAAPVGSFNGIAAVRDVQALSPLPDGSLTVLVTWDILGQTNVPLKVFVHLLPSPTLPGTAPAAQDDQFPADGGLDTTTWEPGSAFVDVYRIDISALASGQYRLVLGLYDPQTNERQLERAGADSVDLLTLTLGD